MNDERKDEIQELYEKSNKISNFVNVLYLLTICIPFILLFDFKFKDVFIIISKKYPVNTFYSWAFPRCLRRSAQCYKITLG